MNELRIPWIRRVAATLWIVALFMGGVAVFAPAVLAERLDKLCRRARRVPGCST